MRRRKLLQIRAVATTECIALSPVGRAKAACAEGADTERALLEVLERDAGWSILGEHLELFDATVSGLPASSGA